MNQRIILPALIGTAFLVTVGVLMRPLWSSGTSNGDIRTATSSVAHRSSLATRSSAPGAAGQPSAAAQPDTAAPGASQAPVGDDYVLPDSATQPDPDAAAEPDPGPTLVPAIFNFFPGKPLAVRSMSDDPLDLTIIAEHPSTHAQSVVTVHVPAHGTADLVKAGLYVDHGYQLTVESPGYLPHKGISVP